MDEITVKIELHDKEIKIRSWESKRKKSKKGVKKAKEKQKISKME